MQYFRSPSLFVQLAKDKSAGHVTRLNWTGLAGSTFVMEAAAGRIRHAAGADFFRSLTFLLFREIW